MKTLCTEHRRQLEHAVIEARDISEAGARVALEALAVHHREPYGHMSDEQCRLRRRLRAHGRHLGDRLDVHSSVHTIGHLIHECAYEHWHGMLFARFLAENNLLIEPSLDIAVTLDECEELAREEDSDPAQDRWVVAARFANQMLPQVFRPEHPAFELQLAREYRLKLEGLIEELPAEIFLATDALGWAYQFWQTRKKNEINDSEVKIGADELPAVTQLFTEPYMVQFLLHNSLGSWWVSRHLDKVCPVDLAYLNRTKEGVPVAGAFEGWPDDLSEFRLLDPCCGSGHFLLAAFLMLVPMRMALERLDADRAVDAVLRENLHGLELDQRCVVIAAFALALEAWRYPDAGGFRTLPKLNLAWCGQPIAGKKEEWLALAENDPRLKAGMAAIYGIFHDAPILGSLIDPVRSVPEDIWTAGFKDLQPLLEKALREHAGEEEKEETTIAALGLAETSRLLSDRYHLVITNVPYLSRGKQNDQLRKFCKKQYPSAKNDLANVFLERCLEFSLDEGAGVTQVVMPQNWLYQIRYKAQREHLSRDVRWELLACLGAGAFETISGEVVKIVLLTLTCIRPSSEHHLYGIDASAPCSASEKAELLREHEMITVSQKDQIENPDARILLEENSSRTLLAEFADAYQGITTGDNRRFIRCFWEVNDWGTAWSAFQSTGDAIEHFSGQQRLFFWEDGRGYLALSDEARIQGQGAWKRSGVAVRQMGQLPCTINAGSPWDMNCASIVPKDRRHLSAIWCFCSSSEYHVAIRKIDQALKVTNATLVKVPFDINHWTRIAQKHYPNGLPQPYSDDPTQWIFHGHPCGSVIWSEEQKRTIQGPFRTDATVLQVAIARLLGYRWPAENDPDMELAEEQRVYVRKAMELYSCEDEDGIVCIPSVRGEQPAQDRLLKLLRVAYGDEWNYGILDKLLFESDGASLDDWLYNKFFKQHCNLFDRRPFIWHIWDGRKRDGFHALVNYHKLAEGKGRGRKLLESLTYSYLGDWIVRQQDDVKAGSDGAADRLAAALELQKRLEAILEGEPPFDVFVRWKPMEEQPVGWEPDINDGVRLNIRPFMTQPNDRKGTGILRTKPNIYWEKDRGKELRCDASRFPWFRDEGGEFIGKRVNCVHFTNNEKRTARNRVT